MASPHALLFLNGNAVYFDTYGEQLFEFQKLGWSGLQAFLKDHRDATVEVQGGVVAPEFQPWFLRHLRVKPGVRPKPNQTDTAPERK